MKQILRHLFAVALFISCNSSYKPASVIYSDYEVNQVKGNDPKLISLLRPYADSVEKTMSTVLGVAGMTFEKKQPEGTLGNLLADILLIKSKEKFNKHIDASILNHGGIRVNALMKGEITRGKVFEMAPFDNLAVLLKLNGKILQEFLDHVTARGGWPVSGMTMQISSGKADNVLINGQPLQPNKDYYIVMPDYVANGGDDAFMLRNIPQENKGVLMRDMYIEYIRQQAAGNKPLMSTIQNRVIDVK